jgi:hypothetical protein
MDIMLHNKHGCWISGGIAFDNKIKALEHATVTKSNIRFYFHDHIWRSFDKNQLGKVSLIELYKQRAIQLRDSYDYLILYYSGGSDSHNILETFLKNNIKIDEIRVRWAKPLTDGKFYTPNKLDTSARNGVSEWNFLIKPELERLKLTHPEIKINIIDFTDKIFDCAYDVDKLEKHFNDYNWYRGAFGSYVQRLNKNLFIPYSNKGKVAHIFGIEKPILKFSQTSVDLVFIDQFLENSLIPLQSYNDHIEFFYWTNDLPLLPLEQAFQVAIFLKNKYLLDKNFIDKVDYLFIEGMHPNSWSLRYKSKMIDVHKSILFNHSWDSSKFSAGKPNESRSDWHFWMYEHKEFSVLKNNFMNAFSNITSKIDSRFLLDAENFTMLGPCTTVPIKLIDLF